MRFGRAFVLAIAFGLLVAVCAGAVLVSEPVSRTPREVTDG